MSESRSPRWHAALAWALVGHDVGLAEPADGPDPEQLAHDLAAAGWPASRVRQHAVDLLAAEQPWPHLIPDPVRAGCGAAQLLAALGRTRALLGLDALETRAPTARTRLDADEVRLLRDVPPHYGR